MSSWFRLELCKTGPRTRRPDGIGRAVRHRGDTGDPGRPGRAAGGCYASQAGDRPGRQADAPLPTRLAFWHARPATRQTGWHWRCCRQLVDPAKWVVEVAAVETLDCRPGGQVAEQAPALVCIGALPPGGLAHARYLCKKLRARFPEVKIIVGGGDSQAAWRQTGSSSRRPGRPDRHHDAGNAKPTEQPVAQSLRRNRESPRRLEGPRRKGIESARQ